MKKVFSIAVAAAIVFLGAAGFSKADGTPAQNDAGTKIESFLTQKSRLLVTDVYILGKVTGLYSSSGTVRAVTAYEPGGKENSHKGLIIEVSEGQRDERTQISYLDIEEIGGLSSAVASMVRLAESRDRTENSYTEITYTTLDGLSFGVYLGESEKEAFITTSGPEKLTVFMEPKKLDEIKKIVDYGHTLLKMK